jgi:rod shape-determining protein MreC
MQKRATIFPVFIGFFLLSLFIFFFLSKPIAGVLESVTVPIQRTLFGSVRKPAENKTDVEKLRDENSNLLIELAKQKELEKENKALRDQFNLSGVSSQTLLPAEIIGTGDGSFIIDKGSSDGVKKGNVIVVKDNLIGRVVDASSHVSVVHLVTKGDVLLSAQTAKTQTVGVIKGMGDTMIFGNVVQSDKLDKGDVVITRGDVDKSGNGYPPHLVIGKITSVNKRASALFQVAEVKSLVDLSKVELVFVMTE